MSAGRHIAEEDLHAYIDGELDDARRGVVEAALAHDRELSARAASFRADKQRMAAIFGPIAQRSLPPAWIARAESLGGAGSVTGADGVVRPFVQRRRRSMVGWTAPARGGWLRGAMAACVVLGLGVGGVLMLRTSADTILADAQAAREGVLPADPDLSGPALPQAAARDAIMRTALGMKVRAPDLSRFGYRLVSFGIFKGRLSHPAAGLVYRNGQNLALTVYVTRSAGQPRFDLLRRGHLRVCIWQDDVVGAVLTGDMSAGEMMRIASRAYADLNL